MTFGSDAPVEPPAPLFGLYAALTRRDERGQPPKGWYPEQCLTLREALQAYTYGAAFAGGIEDEIGKLERGKQADFVVLSDDPFSIPPEGIKEIRIRATFFGGDIP